MNISAEQKLILGLQLVFNDFRQVCAISPDIYAGKDQQDNKGYIGAHMRHVLEFIEIIAGQHGKGVIDYESRQRNKLYEQDPKVALDAFETALKSLSIAVSEKGVDHAVDICEMPAFGMGQVRVPSSLGRELLYAVEHSIHHFAIIAMLAAAHDIHFDEGFGMAPATREHDMKRLHEKNNAQKAA